MTLLPALINMAINSFEQLTYACMQEDLRRSRGQAERACAELDAAKVRRITLPPT